MLIDRQIGSIFFQLEAHERLNERWRHAYPKLIDAGIGLAYFVFVR